MRFDHGDGFRRNIQIDGRQQLPAVHSNFDYPNCGPPCHLSPGFTMPCQETLGARSSSVTRNRPAGDNDLLDSILGGRTTSEIPPADLAEFIARLNKYEDGVDDVARTKRQYQCALLLAKLSPADLAGIATVPVGKPELEENLRLDGILYSLTKKDPARALEWLATHEVAATNHLTVIDLIPEDDPLQAAVEVGRHRSPETSP